MQEQNLIITILKEGFKITMLVNEIELLKMVMSFFDVGRLTIRQDGTALSSPIQKINIWILSGYYFGNFIAEPCSRREHRYSGTKGVMIWSFK